MERFFLLGKVVLTDTHKFLRGICLTKTQLDHIQSFLVFLQYVLLHFLPYEGMKKQDIFFFLLVVLRVNKKSPKTDQNDFGRI